MGTPLKNPPVYFTICQVRFNQLLKLAEFLPAIQEGFRKAAYPAYETQSNLVIQMVAQVSQEGKPEQLQPMPSTHDSYQFGNLERTHLFMLDSQALTLQSTKYGCFEAFSAEFLNGLRIVHEAVDLSFTERVGLRYEPSYGRQRGRARNQRREHDERNHRAQRRRYASRRRCLKLRQRRRTDLDRSDLERVPANGD